MGRKNTPPKTNWGKLVRFGPLSNRVQHTAGKKMHRSNQNLPPALKQWYLDIHYKMQMQGCALQPPKARPDYKELAVLLKTAFDELDKAFTKRWF